MTSANASNVSHPPLVLVVDDDESNREMYSMAIEMAGYWVLGASGAADGLQTARQYKPDVVITDITMPGMDGWAFARALREEPSTAQAGIIAVSGRTHDEMAEQNDGRGDVDVVLVKPCLPDELLRQIKAVLARSELARVKGRDQVARANALRQKSDRLLEKSRGLQRKPRG
jgi:DNA-binding response OmpR family regulator